MRTRVDIVIGAVAVLVLVGLALAWAAQQPWTANHFGYALPGTDGLPAYLFADGRTYATYQVCAGADWCAADRVVTSTPRCWTSDDLPAHGAWPLTKVGSLFTLFGASHDILRATNAGLTTPYVVADGPYCYVLYSLEGGP